MAYSVPTAKLALQLSALAYVDENIDASQQQMIDAINAGLQSAGYADWSVVWGPALDQGRVAASATITRRARKFVLNERLRRGASTSDWIPTRNGGHLAKLLVTGGGYACRGDNGARAI